MECIAEKPQALPASRSRPLRLECPIGDWPMTASEQMFYLGAPLAHVVQYEERLRTRWQTKSRDRARHRSIAAHRPRASAAVPTRGC